VLHVSKRGIFRFGFQNLGETLLGALLEFLWLECAETLGRRAIHMFANVARVRNPIAVVPSVGCTDMHTDASGPRRAL